MLLESVELRQAPFILWIHDLSTKDPYYILPILMGITMFVQQRLNPPPPDPTQAKVMQFLPIFFTALFLNFPSGTIFQNVPKYPPPKKNTGGKHIFRAFWHLGMRGGDLVDQEGGWKGNAPLPSLRLILDL